MAKITNLQCDVTGVADASVATQNPTIPLPVLDDNGNFTGEFKLATLTLDIATERFGEILHAIQDAAKPLFTENTTVKVKGDKASSTSKSGDDVDPNTLDVNDPKRIRAWAESKGLVETGKRGRVADSIKDQYAASDKVIPFTPSENTENVNDESAPAPKGKGKSKQS